MTAVYLKCDSCGATYGGEPGHSGERVFWHGHHWSRTNELIAEAKARGWTGDFTRNGIDKCGECNGTNFLSGLQTQ